MKTESSPKCIGSAQIKPAQYQSHPQAGWKGDGRMGWLVEWTCIIIDVHAWNKMAILKVTLPHEGSTLKVSVLFQDAQTNHCWKMPSQFGTQGHWSKAECPMVCCE